LSICYFKSITFLAFLIPNFENLFNKFPGLSFSSLYRLDLDNGCAISEPVNNNLVLGHTALYALKNVSSSGLTSNLSSVISEP